MMVGRKAEQHENVLALVIAMKMMSGKKLFKMHCQQHIMTVKYD